MNSSKKIKGAPFTTTNLGGNTNINPASGTEVVALDLSYISGGYIDTSITGPDFSVTGDEAVYLYSQYESNDIGLYFTATTIQEVIEDTETFLNAFSESGKTIKQTRTLEDTADLEELNGDIQVLSYNWMF